MFSFTYQVVPGYDACIRLPIHSSPCTLSSPPPERNHNPYKVSFTICFKTPLSPTYSPRTQSGPTGGARRGQGIPPGGRRRAWLVPLLEAERRPPDRCPGLLQRIQARSTRPSRACVMGNVVVKTGRCQDPARVPGSRGRHGQSLGLRDKIGGWERPRWVISPSPTAPLRWGCKA